MRQWSRATMLAEDLAAQLAGRSGPRGAAQRAPPLQVPPAAAHRPPRPAGRRRSHRDHRGAVATWPTRAWPQAWRWWSRALERALRRPPHRRRTAREPPGFAVIGMGKLGGERAQLLVRHRPHASSTATTARPRRARGPHRQRRVLRARRPSHRGHARVGHRGGPRLPGRPAAAARGALGARWPCRWPATAPTIATRAELWERQALHQGARLPPGDERGGPRASSTWRAPFVYRPGLDAGASCARSAAMKSRDRPRAPARKGAAASATSSSARGGIREIEFLIQALQLLYGGDDPWLRERNSLRALFRLTERGYLSPRARARLAHALVYLRTVEHRLQLLHEFQTHTLPEEPRALGLPRAAHGRRAAAGRRARGASCAEHRRVTARRAPRVPRVLRARAPAAARAAGCASRASPSLKATGFADPERARQNLRLVLEGRPLVPYPARGGPRAGAPLPAAARRALAEPGSRRGARPVRALRRRRRGRGPPTSSCWPTARSCSTNLVRLCARRRAAHRSS